MTIEYLIDQFIAWLENTYDSRVNSKKVRTWCLLGIVDTLKGTNVDAVTGRIISLTYDDLQDFFDRQDLNDEYAENFNEKDITVKRPHSFVQVEINLIYAFHKAFNERHRSRLQKYRDDQAFKHYHTPNCIAQGYGIYLGERLQSISNNNKN